MDHTLIHSVKSICCRAACVLAGVAFLLSLLEFAIPWSQTVTYCGSGGISVILTSHGEYWLNPSAVNEVPTRAGQVIRIEGPLLNLQGWRGYQAHINKIDVEVGAVPEPCPS